MRSLPCVDASSWVLVVRASIRRVASEYRRDPKAPVVCTTPMFIRALCVAVQFERPTAAGASRMCRHPESMAVLQAPRSHAAMSARFARWGIPQWGDALAWKHRLAT